MVSVETGTGDALYSTGCGSEAEGNGKGSEAGKK